MEKTRVLDFLCRAAEAIALTFGSNCETLVHDMSKPDHPILAIYNGHVSGRKVGSTVDIFGSSGEPDETVFSGRDFINHLVVTSLGQHIKTTTVHVKGEDYHYALGINFDFTGLKAANRVIDDLIAVDSDLQSAIYQTGQLNLLFDTCVAAIGKPISDMEKGDRLRLIALMKDKGAFKIQKSVPFVAKMLNVSRNTIYHYLRDIQDAHETDEVLEE